MIIYPSVSQAFLTPVFLLCRLFIRRAHAQQGRFMKSAPTVEFDGNPSSEKTAGILKFPAHGMIGSS